MPVRSLFKDFQVCRFNPDQAMTIDSKMHVLPSEFLADIFFPLHPFFVEFYFKFLYLQVYAHIPQAVSFAFPDFFSS